MVPPSGMLEIPADAAAAEVEGVGNVPGAGSGLATKGAKAGAIGTCGGGGLELGVEAADELAVLALVVVVDAPAVVLVALAAAPPLLAALVVSRFCLFLASLCALATTLEMALRLVPLACRRRLDPAPPGPWGPIPPPVDAARSSSVHGDLALLPVLPGLGELLEVLLRMGADLDDGAGFDEGDDLPPLAVLLESLQEEPVLLGGPAAGVLPPLGGCGGGGRTGVGGVDHGAGKVGRSALLGRGPMIPRGGSDGGCLGGGGCLGLRTGASCRGCLGGGDRCWSCGGPGGCGCCDGGGRWSCRRCSWYWCGAHCCGSGSCCGSGWVPRDCSCSDRRTRSFGRRRRRRREWIPNGLSSCHYTVDRINDAA